MTDRNIHHTMKILAKRYARANRLPHHQALDLIANKLGFSHWKAAQTAAKGGWQPSSEQLAEVKAFAREAVPAFQEPPSDGDPATFMFAGDQPPEEGKIGSHTYWIQVSLGDVHMHGEGWHIQLGEAPSAKPFVEVTDRRVKSNPIHDPEFVKDALKIARAKAKDVQAHISADWDRRSTMPDAEGRARHPLFGDEAKQWFCLHCGERCTALAITSNMWHCPNCGASPKDIFCTPFWLGDDAQQDDNSSKDVKVSGRKKVESGAAQDSNLEIEIVDTTPTLVLNEKKIELLIRLALIDDAENPGERMGALWAEIGVDEDNDAYVVLDEDLWPEGKAPVQALKVAKLLGIELDLAITTFTAPFHWPGLAHHTESTVSYVSALLAEYKKYSEQ
ncbi:hypothetical protein [uncultured Roseibium sp.]|uniref:hypothetical protein n=1 Tax=uncultured Roseibium sp. TaxID=1936171 RepID=UPI002625B57A|nr:hypothetical protein [uncultured Roseibium sp.]